MNLMQHPCPHLRRIKDSVGIFRNQNLKPFCMVLIERD